MATMDLRDAIDTGKVDVELTNAVKRVGGLEISDVTNLQQELDAKLETIPNADTNVVGGIRVRIDDANDAVYITTNNTTP